MLYFSTSSMVKKKFQKNFLCILYYNTLIINASSSFSNHNIQWSFLHFSNNASSALSSQRRFSFGDFSDQHILIMIKNMCISNSRISINTYMMEILYIIHYNITIFTNPTLQRDFIICQTQKVENIGHFF